MSVRVVLLAFPPAAWFATFKGVDAHATSGFFEATAQIIPLLLLVLAVEARAFRITTGTKILRSAFMEHSDDEERRAFSAFAQLIYVQMVLLALAVGELAALHALAEHSTHWFAHGNAKPVYAAIVSGLSLAVVAGLISLDVSPPTVEDEEGVASDAEPATGRS